MKKRFNTTTPPGTVAQLPVTVPAKLSNLPGGKLGFLMWLKKAKPGFYAQVAKRDGAAMAGLAGDGENPPAATTAPPTNSWADFIRKLADTFLPIYKEKKVVDMQLDRARQGLPPLEVKIDAPIPASQSPAGNFFASFDWKTVGIAAAIGGGLLYLSRRRRSR